MKMIITFVTMPIFLVTIINWMAKIDAMEPRNRYAEVLWALSILAYFGFLSFIWRI